MHHRGYKELGARLRLSSRLWLVSVQFWCIKIQRKYQCLCCFHSNRCRWVAAAWTQTQIQPDLRSTEVTGMDLMSTECSHSLTEEHFIQTPPPPKKKTLCIPLSKTPDREQTCKLLHPTCKPADTGSQKPQTFDNELEEATPTPSPTIPAHQHGGSNKDTNSKTRKKHKNKNSHSKRAIHRHPAQRHNHCSHSKQPQMAA